MIYRAAPRLRRDVRKSSKNRKRNRPLLEVLEARRMLTATIPPVCGVLEIG
jgi:hypothetical protein